MALLCGDAITMIDENPDLAFVHPEEGVNSSSTACDSSQRQTPRPPKCSLTYLCEPDVGPLTWTSSAIPPPSPPWEMLDDDGSTANLAFTVERVIVLDKAEVFETLPDDINAAMDASGAR